jgi:DNA mismatch endonuclease (patch repair protein)
MNVCKVEGCNKPHMGLGLCDTHYSRIKRNGSLQLVNRVGEKRTIKTKERIKKSWTIKRKQKASMEMMGINNPMYGKTHSIKERKKQSLLMTGGGNPMWGKKHKASTKRIFREQRRYKIIPRIDTLPERIIQKLLKSKGIIFIKHESIKLTKSYHSPDIMIGKTCVEIDGCYFHSCPSCFPDKTKYNIVQLKNIKHDRFVNKELKKLGYNVIRVWEHDIKNNPVSTVNHIINSIGDNNE